MKKEDITQLIVSGAKSVAASVPIAASFSQALSEVESQLSKKRLESLISKIYERLSVLEESALNKEFLQSEEFFDIFRACVEASFRTASDDKRNYIARFLGGIIERGNINDLSLQIAADINDLQDFHLHILDYLPTEAEAPVNAEGPEGMSQEVYNKGNNDLMKMGFIYLNVSDVGKLDIGGVVRKTTDYLVTFKEAVIE